MSKGKKAVVALLAFIIALVGVVYGMFIYSSSQPSMEELLLKEQTETKDLKKYKTYEKDTPFYVSFDDITNRNKYGYYYVYDHIKPIMEKVDSSYIWSSDTNLDVSYGVSRERFEEKIKEFDPDKSMNDLATAIRTCKGLITNMTGHAPEGYYQGLYGKAPIYWAFNPPAENDDPEKVWSTLSAFKEVLTVEDMKDQSTSYMKDNVLLLKGLDLEITNPVVEKVMCIDGFVEAVNMYNMMISADVKTKAKPESFNKCSWIPDEGKTERVTFVIMTSSRTRLNVHFVTDIAVVGYN